MKVFMQDPVAFQLVTDSVWANNYLVPKTLQTVPIPSLLDTQQHRDKFQNEADAEARGIGPSSSPLLC